MSALSMDWVVTIIYPTNVDRAILLIQATSHLKFQDTLPAVRPKSRKSTTSFSPSIWMRLFINPLFCYFAAHDPIDPTGVYDDNGQNYGCRD